MNATRRGQKGTPMQKPIEVYYWPTPNGRKITIACEEMDLPYEVKFVNIGAGDQFEPAFLKISPNNRMPAIVDPDGPGGAPISVFESGAILQYLGRKTGKLYPAGERARVEVDEWVHWQMANLGPMAGQSHHFRRYAPAFLKDSRLTAYGAARYTNEVNRIYGVLDIRLRGREYICGAYSIADIASWPWIVPAWQGQDLNEFPDLKAWYERMAARPAVEKGRAIRPPKGPAGTVAGSAADQAKAQAILFGQRARR
jgi:GST-like protein